MMRATGCRAPSSIADQLLRDLAAVDLNEDERDAITDAIWTAFNEGINAERSRITSLNPCDDHRAVGPTPTPDCKCDEVDRLFAEAARRTMRGTR